MSKFMLKLESKLNESRSPITTKQYMARIKILNGGSEYNNLIFLKDVEGVDKVINDKAPGTQASYYIAIVAVLKQVASYSKFVNLYQKKLDEINTREKKKNETHEKSEKQEKNMIPTSDIEQRKKDLEALLILPITNEKEYMTLIHHLVISLYTDIEPRRNQDYAYMYVVDKEKKQLISERNYYIVSKGEFIFNKYKTAGTYGQQRVKLPEVLDKKLKTFLKYHPLKDIAKEYPLLVNWDGSLRHPVNGMTRLLNSALGGKVGATALRHVFLSDKYGETVKEMKKDQEALGHSASTQSDYIKV